MDLIVELEGREERVRVDRRGPTEIVVSVGDRTYFVDALTARQPWSLLIDGQQHEIAVTRSPRGHLEVSTREGTRVVEVFDPLEHAVRTSEGSLGSKGSLRIDALMPGRVVKVLCAVGDSIEAGQGVMVIEAMKMENEINAEAGGVLAELAVEEGQAVEAGDLLFVVGAEAESES